MYSYMLKYDRNKFEAKKIKMFSLVLPLSIHCGLYLLHAYVSKYYVVNS